MKEDQDKRLGARKEDGIHHEKDHKNWSRRTFLRNMGLAGGASMVLGGLPLRSLMANPLSYALNCSETDRILVMIRLAGGNDGLNTVIPIFDSSTYRNERPNLALRQNEYFEITDELGLNNALSPLQEMWNDGKMKVLNNVGYPDQNLSHFRSTDIWDSSSDSNVMETSGWLGRLFENEYPDYLANPPACPPAIEIGNSGSLLFNNTENLNMGFTFANATALQNVAETGTIYDPVNVPDCFYGEQLSFVRSIANTIYFYADPVNEAFTSSENSVAYPNRLGDQLRLVARLIKGGLGTRVYMVSLGSFDTHSQQIQGPNNRQGAHADLLQNLAESVKAFYDDLAAGGFDKQVLSMTLSEFGRRIEENGLLGTDHGAAAPMMFFGEGLNGNGALGGLPDLQDRDRVGNLKFDTDFRQTYASVMENWLCLDPQLIDDVLGGTFDRIDELDLTCLGVSSTEIEPFSFSYKTWQDSSGQFVVEYSLPASSKIKLSIYNMLGQPVAELYSGQKAKGEHRHYWQPTQKSGINYFVCRLTVNGHDHSKPLVMR
ncbi:MAG TPA: DUF1501 domain-containing protein [Saprospiraceae bacterium]|nr:DUF1501 domain-containing protein [Saprospiraceae bacterium]